MERYRGMTCRFAGNTNPTQLRAPGKISTGITRTKRYCPAPDGTPAKMTVLAMEALMQVKRADNISGIRDPRL
jgi:hypothetical protein